MKAGRVFNFPCPRHPERVEALCTICYPLTEEEKAIIKERETKKHDANITRSWAGTCSFNKKQTND
jgi:hypothetical protein